MGFYTIAAGTTLLAVIVLAALRAVSHRMIGHKAEEDDAPEEKRAGE